MKNKMKLWRREARKHNLDRTKELQESEDPNARARHQGRKFKSSIGSQWMNGALTPLLAALFERVGLVSDSPKV